ncbi:MAG: DegT/DnrJ/EryC1/StrS family aminotransferase, partial [Bacteroidota bacterium]|nr:DegT/DnrJ/EryC1/StrS family aminotransferase [Bacteroidota bacterium]
DYVKTITCGEGGAIITNNETYYENAHQYSDHGHDHIGNDRGAEQHPFLGYNFRISELNAAVGLAQLSRLDEFLSIQKRNYIILREALSQIPEVTFRRVPEGGEENYSFLSFFLPTEETAQKVHKALGTKGVDACFYWYNNNWHYYKKWEHLTQLQSLGNLPQEVKNVLPDYSQSDFSTSDHWMGRTISCLIKLSWSEKEMEERASKMVSTMQDTLFN